MRLDISHDAVFPHDREDLHSHQNEAVDFIFEKKAVELYIDTGIGKTVICLTAIDRMMVDDIDSRTLIIAPVRVAASTWTNEMTEWRHVAWLREFTTVLRVPDDHPEVVSAGDAAFYSFTKEQKRKMNREKKLDLILAADAAERKAASKAPTAEQAREKAKTAKKDELRRALAADGNAIHTINREATEWIVEQYGRWEWVKKNGKTRKRFIVDADAWPYRMLILDEATSFGDYTSRRFKFILSVILAAKRLEYIILLTATPAADGYEKVFSMTYLVDQGKRLGSGITAFRHLYYVPHPKVRHVWKIKKGAAEEISEKIADICMVMKEEDYSEDRTPLFLPRVIDMSDSELRAYKAFERDSVFDTPEGVMIEAETAANLSSKLLQLASGAIYDKEKRTHIIHDHKLEDLAELKDELQGSPILVGYWYKSSLARILKRFPKAREIDSEGALFDGRHSPWNKGEIEMLVVHPASVGHGLNGQYGPGHDLYMFDGCWSYEYYYQLWRRLARPGQQKRVRVHQPKVRGTLDFPLYDRLDMKKDAQETLFQTVRRMWKAR